VNYFAFSHWSPNSHLLPFWKHSHLWVGLGERFAVLPPFTSSLLHK
jgi:hypothetical protein